MDIARKVLDDCGLGYDIPDWLAAGEAVDIDLEAGNREALEPLMQSLSGFPIDISVLPKIGRRKSLLVADMDSTLIQQECIDELAIEIGAGEVVAEITEQAMHGDLAFEPALRKRVALLEGLDVTIIERILKEKITETPGAKTLVATMGRAGAVSVLVSGGFLEFAQVVANRLDIDFVHANRLTRDGTRFSGAIAEPILGPMAKKEALLDQLTRLGAEPGAALAVGDGANDIPMIEAAGLGVAFHGKPSVRAAADACIDHCDLTAPLYLQGFRADEIDYLG